MAFIKYCSTETSIPLILEPFSCWWYVLLRNIAPFLILLYGFPWYSILFQWELIFFDGQKWATVPFHLFSINKMTANCPECNISFQTKNQLDSHRKLAHQSTAHIVFQNKLSSRMTTKSFVRTEDHFNCCYCSYKTEDRSNLARHLKSCKDFIGNELYWIIKVDESDESIENLSETAMDEQPQENNSENIDPSNSDNPSINEVYLESMILQEY